MDPLVEQWLEHLHADRGLAANTIAAYARTLRTLPDPSGTTRDGIETWWRSRSDKSPGTRNNELSAVREFYAWCQIYEHRSDNPAIRIRAVKKPQRIHRYVGRTDLARLLDQLPADLARAVALGAYAGLRVSEAAALDWDSVDRELSRIVVRGKGDKERHIGLPALLLDRLLPQTGGNVVTAGQPPYTAHTLQLKVNRAIHDLGIKETFHALRHRYGTMAVAAGVPITSVARAMGHASPTTTALYVSASDTDLDLIAEAVTR